MNARRIFAPLIFLTTLTACALPGFSTTPAPQPTPTVDTASVETMVAATVSALVAQTEQSAPSPAPAAVVVVTAEFTPMPTATAIPAATSTAISTATAESPSRSALTKQDDGSLLFVDHLAGYEIKLPDGGLIVRINEKEYLDAFSLEEAANPHIQQALLGVQGEDPNFLRLFVLDSTPDHIQNEFVTDARFVLEAGKTLSLTSYADLSAIAEKIPAEAGAFRFEVVAVKTFTSAGGVQFGIIETKSSFQNADGLDVPLYQKRVFFNTKGGVQSIVLTTLEDLKAVLLPVFDATLETIKPIN